MMVVLNILACSVLLVGVYYLSQATEGVGIMAAACFLAIMARIAQADSHFNETKKASAAAGAAVRPVA